MVSMILNGKIIHSWRLILPTKSISKNVFGSSWFNDWSIGIAVVCVSTVSISRAQLLNERIWTWHARHISTCSTWCIARQKGVSFAVPQWDALGTTMCFISPFLSFLESRHLCPYSTKTAVFLQRISSSPVNPHQFFPQRSLNCLRHWRSKRQSTAAKRLICQQLQTASEWLVKTVRNALGNNPRSCENFLKSHTSLAGFHLRG